MTAGREHYLGCAVDSRFVELATAMLASVNANGQVPDVCVVVAAFGLSSRQKRLIRRYAGELGRKLQFVDVDSTCAELKGLQVSRDYSASIYGKVLLPGLIGKSAGRLVCLDSDMIVNHSLAHLFTMPMDGHPLAAVRDHIDPEQLARRSRAPDPNYFNAGLMVIELQPWIEQRISDRTFAVLRSGARPLFWPEQDALNEVLGPDWKRLERAWNFYYGGGSEHLVFEDYQAAHIVHFTGTPKPNSPACRHPAGTFYRHHARRPKRQGPAWVERALEQLRAWRPKSPT
ncbi:Lipopolysaccharide biosynthesis protein, LPS:glycosyltransferase [Faunimonas pinastri]|uniref:Lipopolysaccharide biosynthesis protein, LPS:glycosyltransferase n=1 Tax=Faunimonas pinastri TaxID=1855383 RepID=A0A1H9PM72_9HYPH|nr:glycosyltransferase family 8 protein [Faunimonas pinastri]SER49190.1 Lipopolysaccharide biosynthesis protein, LPS:glycosyltransferase [Faunimonas pinastri]